MSALEPVPVVAHPSGVDALRTAIMRADADRARLAEAGDTTALAFGLADLRALSRDLSMLARAVEDDVARLMASKTMTVDGLGTLERRRGTERRQWDSEALFATLVRSELDPDGTGELPPAAETLERVRALVADTMPLTGSFGWRVTALRARGVDPDEWASCTPGRTTVQIHGDSTP